MSRAASSPRHRRATDALYYPRVRPPLQATIKLGLEAYFASPCEGTLKLVFAPPTRLTSPLPHD